jgi:NAD(P)-dependent dehydrogenase (short-subunit alcohol dehydrogenase family)
MRSVVITGTSTGIGWGAAKVLIANGFRVFGSVRKRADADRLKAEFGQSYVPLLFDVTEAGAVKEAAAEVRAALAGETLAGLSTMPEWLSPARYSSCRSKSFAAKSRLIWSASSS